MHTLGWWFGGAEIVVVAIIALLLFGGRLPEVGRSLGRGITEFRKGLKDVKDEIEGGGEDDDSSGNRAS